MIDHAKLALARDTVNMGASAAFQDMLSGLRADTDELERLAVNPLAPYGQRKNAFLEWSAHRAVVKGMEETIENASREVAAVEEEIEIERANERDRAHRTNW